MRLAYFCIGSIANQDLLISKCFLPDKTRTEQVQNVWTAFLNVFQEQDWPVSCLQATPPASITSPPQATSTVSMATTTSLGVRRMSGMAGSVSSSDASSATLVTRAPTHVAVPLVNQQDGSCYVYKVVADVVLVAVCPPPLAAFETDRPVGPASLVYSFHALIEFLDHLTRAFERYIHPTFSSTTTIRATLSSTPTKQPDSSVPNHLLSVSLITANASLIYEVLDECIELGYPIMPSLQQLDLLIFGKAQIEQ